MRINSLYTYVITAGSNYLDIDAYACCVAMQELFKLLGQNAVVYSKATVNYSVCNSLKGLNDIGETLPAIVAANTTQYIVVDVSDPSFIQPDIPLDRVAMIFDHHTGFEEYWKKRIGEDARIEFIGAAATLVFREWGKAGLKSKMSRRTALLLIAAILDNTLYLSSGNTTWEDIAAFNELCSFAGVDGQWCEEYFVNVQRTIESDLIQAILKDIKSIPSGIGLPRYIAQITVWNAEETVAALERVRGWLTHTFESWMLNIMDVGKRKSVLVCEDIAFQNSMMAKFNARFENGIAVLSQPYLRKEIIRICKE